LTARSLVALAAAVLVGCAAGPDDGKPDRVRTPGAAVDRIWQWTGTATPAGTIESPAPERYTLELAPNGRLRVRADCNRGTGSYRIGAGTINFDPIATTRMACPPGSLDARFLGDLQRATGFFVEGGHLHLELPADAGTMRFAPRQ
jgi:heat shock protein HslJ